MADLHANQAQLHAGDFDDPEPGMTWFVTFAAAIVLTALVLGLSALYFGMSDRWTEELIISAPAEEYEQLRSAQMELLAAPRRFEVLDLEGNLQPRVGIPIGEAIERMVSDGRVGGGQEGSP